MGYERRECDIRQKLKDKRFVSLPKDPENEQNPLDESFVGTIADVGEVETILDLSTRTVWLVLKNFASHSLIVWVTVHGEGTLPTWKIYHSTLNDIRS